MKVEKAWTLQTVIAARIASLSLKKKERNFTSDNFIDNIDAFIKYIGWLTFISSISLPDMNL